MTRKFTLFLASMLIVFSAGATMPMINTVAADEQSDTLATEQSEDNGFWWGASFDLASNYLWRGYDQSYRGGNGNMFDPSIQPGVSFGYGKFYVDLWFNHSLVSKYNEFDIFLGFEHENLTVTLYDVLCGVGSEFAELELFDGDNHSLTATIDYTFFDCLRLHWATTFIHSADKLDNGKQAFSSYFEAAYTLSVGDLFDVELTAGASPWSGPFWMAGPQVKQLDGSYALDWDNVPTGFNVTNLSVMLNKEFEMNDLCFPVQTGYVYNPTTKCHYAILKAGISF
ncbi:MAG: hypothetical protein IKK05_01990 [Alistipes sp.]|nr:hypothetical protein [Alistipes sp.]